jgi:hypothetical protein
MTAEDHVVELPGEVALRAVLVEPHLLEHDLLLEIELGLVEHRVDADVGEHLDRRHRAQLRKHRVVEGVVPRGARVHPSADALDVAVDESPRPGRRTLEEHVLEVMRQAQLGRGLVSSAGANPQLHRDDLAGSKLLDDDPHAVRQDVAHGHLRSGSRPWSLRARAALHGQRDEQREQKFRGQAHMVSQAITGPPGGQNAAPDSASVQGTSPCDESSMS